MTCVGRGAVLLVLLCVVSASCAGAAPVSVAARFQANLLREPLPLLCHLARRGVLTARMPARCKRAS